MLEFSQGQTAGLGELFLSHYPELGWAEPGLTDLRTCGQTPAFAPPLQDATLAKGRVRWEGLRGRTAGERCSPSAATWPRIPRLGPPTRTPRARSAGAMLSAAPASPEPLRAVQLVSAAAPGRDSTVTERYGRILASTSRTPSKASPLSSPQTRPLRPDVGVAGLGGPGVRGSGGRGTRFPAAPGAAGAEGKRRAPQLNHGESPLGVSSPEEAGQGRGLAGGRPPRRPVTGPGAGVGRSGGGEPGAGGGAGGRAAL